MPQTSIKILVVDDEQELLEILSNSLSRLGYQLLTATNVKTAFELIQEHGDRLAIVISDLRLPGEDGLDLRRKMMENHKSIPFLVLSGFVTREVALLGVELKISAFIEKPYDEASLLKLIASEIEDRILTFREDDELLEGFVVEALQLIEEMEGLALNLEGAVGEPEVFNRIFACAHTIKGTSGYFKPDHVHRFTHKFEDYLSQFKANPQALDTQCVSTILKSIDTIRALTLSLKERKSSPISVETLCEIFNANTAPRLDAPQKSLADADRSQAAANTSVDRPASDDLRVSVHLLDAFMERSGELTVLRNMVNKVVRVIESENPTNANILVLADLLSEMHKANMELQDQIVDLRKIPLRQVFKPLARTVRDLSVSLKKPIHLEIVGDDLRVDHAVADQLGRCLIHMIRNSADHGIEPPEQRELHGKPKQGIIRLIAEANSEEVTVSVQDDGRGIDANAVKESAIKKQLITRVKADQLSESQLRMLIFEPGFSTAEKITDVSGRGVGTDMVMKTILAANGKILLDSKLKVGTEFKLILPIPKSVLIISSLLVKIGGKVLAIPREAIVRVIVLSENDVSEKVQKVKNTSFYESSAGLLPILNLNSFMFAHQDIHTSVSQIQFLIQLTSSSGAFCVEVDEVLDVEDTVVKRIGGWLQKIPIFLGATFLGDGGVGLILDPEGIAKSFGIQIQGERADHASTSADKKNGLQGFETSILLLSLGTKTVYGVRQQDLFRLEEIEKDKIQYVGEQAVVIYRNQTMPLQFLVQHVDDPPEGMHWNVKNRVLVTYRDGRYCGFVVEHILDFVTVPSDQLHEFPENQLKGELIIQKKAVVVLNLHLLNPPGVAVNVAG